MTRTFFETYIRKIDLTLFSRLLSSLKWVGTIFFVSSFRMEKELNAWEMSGEFNNVWECL